MKNLLFLFVLALSLQGCSSVTNVQKKSLDGSWVMQQMTGVTLDKDKLTKGLPVFRFDLAENRFSGHAGCNQLASEINIAANEITFKGMISTKMACENMEVEDAVLKILNNTLHYEIKDSELTLVSPDGTEMHFIMEENN